MQNSGMNFNYSASSPVKILVVDDHPNAATLLARSLSRLGARIDVVSATSGPQALEWCVQDGAIDIVITDMDMPDMTGLELIDKLNNQPSISPAVSFLLTAHDSAGLREIAQRLNVKQVIVKPVNPEWICQLILRTVEELNQAKSLNDGPVSPKPAKKNPSTEPKREDLNISQLLREVANIFQPQADIKNQILVVEKTEPDLKVRGNVIQLRQALQILVREAIKNTPRGGTVILSCENESHFVKIYVRDTGYGIDGHFDNWPTDEDLTTVKSIAEQHGGDVVVEREPGKGTCFTVSLPCCFKQEFQSADVEQ
jgi:signal transduction histidine kinase